MDFSPQRQDWVTEAITFHFRLCCLGLGTQSDEISDATDLLLLLIPVELHANLRISSPPH